MDLKKIRKLIFLAKFNEKFNEYKGLIDLLTLLGIKNPIFTVIGLSSHFIHAIIELLSKDYKNILSSCELIPTSEYVDQYILNRIIEFQKFKYDDMSFYEINDHILIYSDNFYCYPSFTQEFKQQFLSLVLPKFSGFEIISKDSQLDFVDLTLKTLSSSKGEELWERTRKFINIGISRSILLNGPPGSGKTELALFLAEKVKNICNGKILRISTSNIEINYTDLKLVLDFLKVDIVIFDDIDRFDNLNSILNLLETNKSRHKLFIATSNLSSVLPSAAKRPGRFDEIYQINKLPPELLKNKFSELYEYLDEEQRIDVLQLQAAHLNELNLRFLALQQDFNFEKEFNDLISFSENEEYDDYDD